MYLPNVVGFPQLLEFDPKILSTKLTNIKLNPVDLGLKNIIFKSGDNISFSQF